VKRKKIVKVLPYIATAGLGIVLSPDVAFAAGGNPILNFLNTAVTQVTLAGFGIAALGVSAVGGGVATGNHQFVGPGLKAGGGGATIAGASQLIGLFIPNAGGASIDPTTAAMTVADWLRLLAAAFS